MNAEELQLDVSAEHARALHRIVRAMHDGHCPKCGHLGGAEEFRDYSTFCHRCPVCEFYITSVQAEAAFKAFQPHLRRSLEVFESWRSGP